MDLSPCPPDSVGVPSMTAKSGGPARRHMRARRPQYRRRFGLAADAVHPLFSDVNGARPRSALAPRGGAFEATPDALAVFEPGMSATQRFLARLGTSRKVDVAFSPRPVSLKGVFSVGLGGVAGMMLAQPFDVVTFMAPLFGLVVGSVGGAMGWVALRGRRATTIEVETWRPQLDAIARILQNADHIGQPFASPSALRVALHSALWHAINAVDQPGDQDVLIAFDEQLVALQGATEATLVELESPSIAARKAAVSERLADAVSEFDVAPLANIHEIATGDGHV
jgi:hypothetical protein